MKKVIYKFTLKEVETQTIQIPKGSVLMSVQAQNNKPCLWAVIHDTQAEIEEIKIRTLLTGQPFSDEEYFPTGFLGTYQLNGGAFVGHVFVE